LEPDNEDDYDEDDAAQLHLLINADKNTNKVQHRRASVGSLEERLKHAPVGLDPRLPWWVRVAVPLLITFNIGLFIISNTSTGAAVFVYFTLGAKVFESPSLFSFGLANSVHDMWQAGVIPLSLLIAIFSGAWPYLKLLLMLAVWFTPQTVLSISKRERVLMFLDALGKWSLIDSFVLVFMMVAFRFNIVIPASSIAHTNAGITTIDLFVKAGLGFYSFLWATMLSLVITHIILAAHRWTVDDANNDKQNNYVVDGNARRALCMVDFPLKGSIVRYTPLGIALILALLCCSGALVVAGSCVNSFVFNFLGAAGAMFPYTGVAARREFSLLSLALSLPSAAQNPNSFGVRSVQATFMLFAFAMPIFYLFSLLVLWVVPLRPKQQAFVFHVVEICRAWSGMEVFVLAVIAALTELEQFAQFLVGSNCDTINPILAKYFSDVLNGNTKCFDVTATLLKGCWLMFGACFLYMLAGTVVIKVCLRVIDARHGRGDVGEGAHGTQHWRTRLWLKLGIIKEV
jgi:hypothetical protein